MYHFIGIYAYLPMIWYTLIPDRRFWGLRLGSSCPAESGFTIGSSIPLRVLVESKSRSSWDVFPDESMRRLGGGLGWHLFPGNNQIIHRALSEAGLPLLKCTKVERKMRHVIAVLQKSAEIVQARDL